jgi:hypothetical protein
VPTFDDIWAVISVIGAIAGIGLIIYLQAQGPKGHDREDAAREHFDRTGRWPDEEPGA